MGQISSVAAVRPCPPRVQNREQKNTMSTRQHAIPGHLNTIGAKLWTDLLRLYSFDSAALAVLESLCGWHQREQGLLSDPGASLTALAKATANKIRCYKTLGLDVVEPVAEKPQIWSAKRV